MRDLWIALNNHPVAFAIGYIVPIAAFVWIATAGAGA